MYFTTTMASFNNKYPKKSNWQGPHEFLERSLELGRYILEIMLNSEKSISRKAKKKQIYILENTLKLKTKCKHLAYVGTACSKLSNFTSTHEIKFKPPSKAIYNIQSWAIYFL